MRKFCTKCGVKLEKGICPKCSKGFKYSVNGSIDSKKIKDAAKELMADNFFEIFRPTLISFLIMLGLEIMLECFVPDNHYFYSLLSLLCNLIIVPMGFGLAECYLCFIRKKDFNLLSIFNFYDKRILKVWGVTLLISLFTMLWSLLFVVPGIIALLSYSQYMYILIDNENYSSLQIINESKRMMDGYKGDYFSFIISFIGWFLLSMLTFGIALIYVMPYVTISSTLYYNELKLIKSEK